MFKQLFPKPMSVIGMVHVGALPGTPLYQGSVQKLIDKACSEAEIYMNNKIDGLLVENMNDIPYVQSKHLLPETTAIMTRICSEISKIAKSNRNNNKSIPCGVQILASANKEALAVAQASNFDFIRAEGFVFSHVADEGFTDACAGNILRYRKQIGADNVLIFTDIKKKHSSHAITSDVSLIETAKAAEFFMSDGLILTGLSTGCEANPQELNELKENCTLPIIIGSGITLENVAKYKKADAFIIGSHFKRDGHWKNELCKNRLARFMEKTLSFK